MEKNSSYFSDCRGSGRRWANRPWVKVRLEDTEQNESMVTQVSGLLGSAGFHDAPGSTGSHDAPIVVS